LNLNICYYLSFYQDNKFNFLIYEIMCQLVEYSVNDFKYNFRIYKNIDFKKELGK